MSKIKDLIKEMCPNGVPFKKVGDICETITDYVAAGSFKDLANNVKYLQEPDYAMLIRTTDIKSKFKGDKFIYINESAFNYLWRVNLDKDSLILPNIGNCGEIYYLTPADLPYKRCALATNAILVRSDKINMKYLKHAFLANDFQIQLKRITSPSGQTKFNKTDLKKLLVPVPPIKVQEEIVRILDKFGELEAELEAELEVRKSQYEFWRDRIFRFENRTDVKWLRLGDIKTDIYRGSGIKRDEVTEDGIPCVRYGEIYTTYNIWFDKCKSHTSKDVVNKPKTFSNSDLLFAITGENVEDISKTIVYTGNDTCYAGGDIVVMKHQQNGKYLSYALSTNDAIKQKGKGKVKSKVVHSSVPSIEDIVVPIVSLKEQEKIVENLDKFYNLINSLECGLPAEIELRRKQYEYYRNKLLSFEELSVNE